jgi:chromosome segregation protein
MERIENQLSEVKKKFDIADAEQKEANETYESIKNEYGRLEQQIADADEAIEAVRGTISDSTVTKEKLEGQINVLNEQIRSAQVTDEHLKSRLDSIDQAKAERMQQRASYDEEKAGLDKDLEEISHRRDEAQSRLQELQDKIARCNKAIEQGKNEIIEILNNRASTKAKQQRYDTMAEQVNIRKAQLTQRLLARQTEESDLEITLYGYVEELDKVNSVIDEKKKSGIEMEAKMREWHHKHSEANRQLEQSLSRYH